MSAGDEEKEQSKNKADVIVSLAESEEEFTVMLGQGLPCTADTLNSESSWELSRS